MSQPRTVILDIEAVQAVTDVRHRKHRRIIALLDAMASRNLKRAGSVRIVVPTAVRVEAGWDRQASSAAVINRLRAEDCVLDANAADIAVRVRDALAVSVADAHLAAAIILTDGPHAIVSSDEGDVRRIVNHLGIDARIVPV